jgi:hypothetical protein
VKHLALAIAALAAGCVGYDEIESRPAAAVNHKPYIESAEPAEGIVFLKVGDTKQFRIVVDDPDGDRFFGYRWKLNGDVQGNGSFYTFTANRVALEDLAVTVWDCPGVGTNNDFTGLLECQETPPDSNSTVVHRWAVKVEPEG